MALSQFAHYCDIREDHNGERNEKGEKNIRQREDASLEIAYFIIVIALQIDGSVELKFGRVRIGDGNVRVEGADCPGE